MSAILVTAQETFATRCMSTRTRIAVEVIGCAGSASASLLSFAHVDWGAFTNARNNASTTNTRRRMETKCTDSSKKIARVTSLLLLERISHTIVCPAAGAVTPRCSLQVCFVSVVLAATKPASRCIHSASSPLRKSPQLRVSTWGSTSV